MTGALPIMIARNLTVVDITRDRRHFQRDEKQISTEIKKITR